MAGLDGAGLDPSLADRSKRRDALDRRRLPHRADSCQGMTRNDAAPGCDRGLSAAGGSPTADGSHDNDNLFSSSRDGLPQPAQSPSVLSVARCIQAIGFVHASNDSGHE